jgi:V/A-type H+-transporting ATPase subunit A
MNGKIVKVSGPLVVAANMRSTKMFDMVYVGASRLIGEVIELRGEHASIQVYEDTAGLKIGDTVVSTGSALSIELAPGIMSGIFDGIGRPIKEIFEKVGPRIARGVSIETIGRARKWEFVATVKNGDMVQAGDIIGVVKENEVVEHRIMIPYGVRGTVTQIRSGNFTVSDVIARVSDPKDKAHEITMMQKWPVRVPRPYKEKIKPHEPLVTGQRVIDTLFPVAKGGVAAIPGPFGSGKTVVQHQIAKWADADIVVYIGCGERGNEICDVLNEFPELVDKRTNQPLIKRTIIIANTSDMPVAAREASIYTGITIAEYFRDMGYNVAIMADSTSRFAEALREMSGRMEELPGEEGYPAYLASRIAGFYERAGVVKVLCSETTTSGHIANGGERYERAGRTGSVTAIGAVSPPGGDLSEPVAQCTMRIVKTFWALSYALAHRRHFPAIDWLQSYSLYPDQMAVWYANHVSPQFLGLRTKAIKILQQDAELQEIVRLVGVESLNDLERSVLDTAKKLKDEFLFQNAFDADDTFTNYKRQYEMLSAIVGGVK